MQSTVAAGGGGDNGGSDLDGSDFVAIQHGTHVAGTLLLPPSFMNAIVTVQRSDILHLGKTSPTRRFLRFGSRSNINIRKEYSPSNR